MELEQQSNASTRLALDAFRAADLNRFLVVCALVSDLYCPGYHQRQSLEKTSNLAYTAARYKIDTSKIVGTVREELSSKVKNRKGKSKEARKSKKVESRAPKRLTGKRQK